VRHRLDDVGPVMNMYPLPFDMKMKSVMAGE
jgi:hypothetical protein